MPAKVNILSLTSLALALSQKQVLQDNSSLKTCLSQMPKIVSWEAYFSLAITWLGESQIRVGIK